MASLPACNAVIAAFPAVGHGDSPENEAGFVNIEPNYANELTGDSAAEAGSDWWAPAQAAGDPAPSPSLLSQPEAATWGPAGSSLPAPGGHQG